MLFYQKLDFLMNITKTTNSSLSMQISLDASHISRLRRGQRRLVPNAEYIEKMAAYFVRQCVEEYQKSALLEILKRPAALFDDPAKAVEQLYLWLLADEKNESASVAGFLNGLNIVPSGSFKNNSKNYTIADIPETIPGISLYYGREGKREAVIRFLSIVVKIKKPGYIFLYSDESMDWMTQDSAFQLKWMELLYKVISRGNRIKIIHTVSRNLDEMLEALSKWIPLYMTGAIEPYYYPKKRDGIFRRTMFIAPEKAAVSSNSFDSMSDKVTNILFTEEKAIESMAEEFNCYLSLCKPLMRIFSDKDRNEYLRTLDEFEKEIENTILKTERLSLLTMPDHIFGSMLKRADVQRTNDLMDYFHIRKEKFLAEIRIKKFNEIIKLDEVIDICDGSVPIGYTGIPELFGVKYRPDEYRDHLSNIINLLNIYDNYNVVINRGVTVNNYRVYAKEDLGAIVEKTTEPHAIFALNEVNMTAAFWDYLNVDFNEKKNDKQRVIEELENLVEKLC